MARKEDRKTEFKRSVADSIKKEIVAFLNTDGGTIYVGMDDDGIPCGVADPAGDSLRIISMARDSIRPDATMLFHVDEAVSEGKAILVVTVQKGTSRPYYLSQKGLTPSGVYVREGSASVPASDALIRSLILGTRGDSFEKRRSFLQELTFQDARSEFASRNIPFGLREKRNLGLVDEEGCYTNLALLLSDQCPLTIKAASFGGDETPNFRDRREFGGSLFRQMREAYGYLDFRNLNHGEIHGLLRTDRTDYPEEALREVLINLIVHRDYSLPASSLIRLYEDRVEILSAGGLPLGTNLEDALSGFSVCRNPALASLFHRFQLIEAFGTGIRKILTSYEGARGKPLFRTTMNTFLVTLPNRNHLPPKERTQGPSRQERSSFIPEEWKETLRYIEEHGTITRGELSSLLEVSTATATRLLARLSEEGVLKRKGKGRGVKYVLGEEEGLPREP